MCDEMTIKLHIEDEFEVQVILIELSSHTHLTECYVV